ncbi:MAG: hypothetical protein WA110_00395 [Anaerolineaceae bacterium]
MIGTARHAVNLAQTHHETKPMALIKLKVDWISLEEIIITRSAVIQSQGVCRKRAHPILKNMFDGRF